ncbi:MAG TPA: enolase C-terminal domain-like protein [Gemmatimonadales bacterium]|nr:enolase C-terminal domain-like protein [Gemmatimonadales bacterium]
MEPREAAAEGGSLPGAAAPDAARAAAALDAPLEIAGVRLFEVAVPLVEPFRISGGTLDVRRSLIVEVTSASGAVGYGESAPFEAPFYSEETLQTCAACIAAHLIPLLAARSFASLEAAAGALEGVRGNRMARAGVETALWDLVSAQHGVPLRHLVGVLMERLGVLEEFRGPAAVVESGAALGIPADGQVATLAARARDAVGRGHRRVKIKVMPGWDVEPVRAVRAAVGPEIPIWADANGAYARDRDAAALAALDREHLAMLEQPLPPDDAVGTIRLSQELVTPVCLDESLTGEGAAQLFLECDGPVLWNVKVQRVGGLWESARIYRRAMDAGVALWAGSMPETGVGMHAVLSLAAFPGFIYPSDAAPSASWYEPGSDLIEWRMDGRALMAVSDTPGLANLGVRERLAQVGRVLA